jgi:molybdopterin converting factor small subunit
MAKVQVEFWAWIGKDLDVVQPISDMRSLIEVELEEGITVINLFEKLAKRYTQIQNEIFDHEEKSFNRKINVIVTHNNQIISPFDLGGDVLNDGDKILILPYYAGG